MKGEEIPGIIVSATYYDLESRIRVSDPDLIKHILSNLLSNAAKFTPTESIQIRVRNRLIVSP